MPGVEAVGISSAFPLTGGSDVGIRFDGPPRMGTTANYFRVTPRYLRVMQIPLIRGRVITEQDAATSSQVVLINETMARVAATASVQKMRASMVRSARRLRPAEAAARLANPSRPL